MYKKKKFVDTDVIGGNFFVDCYRKSATKKRMFFGGARCLNYVYFRYV